MFELPVDETNFDRSIGPSIDMQPVAADLHARSGSGLAWTATMQQSHDRRTTHVERRHNHRLQRGKPW